MPRSHLHQRIREIALAVGLTVAAVGFLLEATESGDQTLLGKPSAVASTSPAQIEMRAR